MKISVAVCGTSNAVFEKGYVAGLAAPANVSGVSNFSIGASGSQNWAFFRKDLLSARPDWVVLDFAVNDFLLIGADDGIRDIVNIAMDDAIADCMTHGIKPFVFMLPSITVHKFGKNQIETYRNIISKYNLPYLNCYELLDLWTAEMRDVPFERLFRDPSHFHPEIANLLGQWIGDWLAQQTSTAPGMQATVQRLPAALEYVSFADRLPAGLPRVQKGSRLLKADFVRLEEGETWSVDLSFGTRITGLVFDAAKSAGVIRISDVDGASWEGSITDIYSRNWMVARILSTPGCRLNLRSPVTIQVVPENRPDRMELWKTSVGDDGRAAMLGLGVVAEVSVASDPVPTAGAAPRNMLSSLDAAGRRDLLDKIRSAIPG